MAFAQDYVSVAERVAEFYERYPDGGIQTEIVTHTDSLVVVKAYAYRNAADPFPGGVGHSQLNIPGTTNFTRGSEVENCETSAVGRALAFLGFAAKDGIASREEVANKRESSPPAGEGSGGRTQTNPSPANINGAVTALMKWTEESDIAGHEAMRSLLGGDASPETFAAWLAIPGNNPPLFKQQFNKLAASFAKQEALA